MCYYCTTHTYVRPGHLECRPRYMSTISMSHDLRVSLFANNVGYGKRQISIMNLTSIEDTVVKIIQFNTDMRYLQNVFISVRILSLIVNSKVLILSK